MRILMIRHGDPDYEHDSLTENGKMEAQLLAERMKREKADSCRKLFRIPEGMKTEIICRVSCGIRCRPPGEMSRATMTWRDGRICLLPGTVIWPGATSVCAQDWTGFWNSMGMCGTGDCTERRRERTGRSPCSAIMGCPV